MSLFGWNPGLRRPVAAGVTAEAMSGWGRPRSGHAHAGLDIPLRIGTPILAMASGKAVRVQATNAGDAAGIWVGVQHDDGLVSRYMHLSRADVRVGDQVRAGQQLGLSGNTGIHNSGPHLHVDLKAPGALLPAIASAGGKPTSGFGPEIKPYGFAVPGEPWIPVDRYNQRTIDDAKANGIPLYRPGAGGLVTLALAGGVAYGVYRLLR